MKVAFLLLVMLVIAVEIYCRGHGKSDGD